MPWYPEDISSEELARVRHLVVYEGERYIIAHGYRSRGESLAASTLR